LASGHGARAKTVWRTSVAAATFAEAVREDEEVVPVNVSTWVLPSGVTVGR
jgi:urease subunit gamma